MFESLVRKTRECLCCERMADSSGCVAQLVRALSQYAKVVGVILSQGTCKNRPVNAQISGRTNRCLSLSLPPHFLSLSNQLKIKNIQCITECLLLLAHHWDNQNAPNKGSKHPLEEEDLQVGNLETRPTWSYLARLGIVRLHQ